MHRTSRKDSGFSDDHGKAASEETQNKAIPSSLETTLVLPAITTTAAEPEPTITEEAESGMLRMFISMP